MVAVRRGRRAHCTAPVDPVLALGGRCLDRVRRPARKGAREAPLPRARRRAGIVHAVDGPAPGGRRRRALLLVRPSRPVRAVPRPLVRRDAAVHDGRRRRGADLRGDAVPRADGRGGTAPGGRALRGCRSDARRHAVVRVPAGDAADDPAGADRGRGARLGSRTRRVRRIDHFAGNFPGRTRTVPIATYLALESDPEQALVLSLALIAVSFGVLLALRERCLGAARAVPG